MEVVMDSGVYNILEARFPAGSVDGSFDIIGLVVRIRMTIKYGSVDHDDDDLKGELSTVSMRAK